MHSRARQAMDDKPYLDGLDNDSIAEIMRRTPLQRLIGYIDYLDEGGHLTSEKIECLQCLVDEATTRGAENEEG